MSHIKVTNFFIIILQSYFPSYSSEYHHISASASATDGELCPSPFRQVLLKQVQMQLSGTHEEQDLQM